MSKYEVTKSEVLEIMTRIPAEIKLFKDLKTGRIVGELMIESQFFGDFNITERGFSCCPNDPEWVRFFEGQFDDFEYADVIRSGY